MLKDEDGEARIAAALALGRMGPEAKAAVADLATALTDADPTCRCRVALALCRIDPDQTPTGLPVLLKLLQNRTGEIRGRAAWALGTVGPAAREAAPALGELLKDEEPIIRLSAAYALWRIDPQAKAASAVLVGAWREEPPTSFPIRSRLDIVRALGKMGREDKAVVAFLIELSRDDNRRVRLAAAEVVKQLDPEAAKRAGLP
jgi:hypothetical protein